MSAISAMTDTRAATYRQVATDIELLLEGETDFIAALATVVCELHRAFDHYHWTGFYRALPDAAAFMGRMLVVGPYQGGHGCLRIPFDKGVCGAAARTGQTQLVPDVELFPGHIACSSSTRSEIVVPVFGREGELLAVFDVDSDHPDAFGEVDKVALEAICKNLGARFTHAA
jgi:GAF domain-containing protein